MIFSRETYIHDAELEIIVPNGIVNFNEENIGDIIDGQQRTQIFYDELLHIYLLATLPPESNFENKEEATEFFKKLEVTLQATLIDTPYISGLSSLTVSSSNHYSSELVRTLSSSSTASSIGPFSGGTSMKSCLSSSSTLPSTPGSPGSFDTDCSHKRSLSSKVIEGTVIYSSHYSSKKNNNNEMVVVKRDGCWICVLPLLFPVAHIKTRAQGQIALSVTVTQSQRKVKPSDSNLYSMDHFGMNLLEGLNDDPAFESMNFSIPTFQSTKQSIYSNLPPTPIKRCARKILSVKSTLNARIRTVYVSPENTITMSVELENDTEHDITFSIEDVKVEIANAFVTKLAWGPQDTFNDKVPITLRSLDQVNFLFNVTILEDPSFPEPMNTQQFYSMPISYSKTSSRRTSVASINSTLTLNTPSVEDKHRKVSVIVKGCPVIDGVKSRCIESKLNYTLDMTTLLKDDSMASTYLRELESNKYDSMICNDTFNYNGIREGFHKETVIHDSFSLKNVKNYDEKNIIDNKQHSESAPVINDDDENNGILPNGRLPKLQKQKKFDLNVCDGVFVSFVVSDKPIVGKIFTMKVFVANKSKHVRNFSIMIPNKKSLNENHLPPRTLLSQSTDVTLVDKENVHPLEDLFMNETVILRKHLEYNADLICLDNDVRIGPINPYDSESATLRFISSKEALHAVEHIQLIDDDTGFITNLRNAIHVNVAKNKRRMKRINRNSTVLRQIEVTG